MTDGISKLGRSAVEMNSPADNLKNNKTSNEATAQKAEMASPAPANDEVILSETVEKAMATGDFDAAKVAEIKTKYPEQNVIDLDRIQIPRGIKKHSFVITQ